MTHNGEATLRPLGGEVSADGLECDNNVAPKLVRRDTICTDEIHSVSKSTRED